MKQPVYFNQLSEDCWYEVIFTSSMESKILGHRKLYTFKNYYRPCDFVSFANELCKGLSHYGKSYVEVHYEGTRIYRVETRNHVVPYVGYRYCSDKVRESFPHYHVNPFYEVLDSF